MGLKKETNNAKQWPSFSIRKRQMERVVRLSRSVCNRQEEIFPYKRNRSISTHSSPATEGESTNITRFKKIFQLFDFLGCGNILAVGADLGIDFHTCEFEISQREADLLLFFLKYSIHSIVNWKDACYILSGCPAGQALGRSPGLPPPKEQALASL